MTVNAVTPTEEATGAPLTANTAPKPIRFWFEVGGQDLFYPVANIADGMHDWVLANARMAKALQAQGYHYQLVHPRFWCRLRPVREGNPLSKLRLLTQIAASATN